MTPTPPPTTWGAHGGRSSAMSRGDNGGAGAESADASGNTTVTAETPMSSSGESSYGTNAPAAGGANRRRRSLADLERDYEKSGRGGAVGKDGKDRYSPGFPSVVGAVSVPASSSPFGGVNPAVYRGADAKRLIMSEARRAQQQQVPPRIGGIPEDGAVPRRIGGDIRGDGGRERGSDRDQAASAAVNRRAAGASNGAQAEEGGEGGGVAGALPFVAFRAHPEGRGARGPVSVDDVTLTTVRPFSGAGADDQTYGDGTESVFAPTVSSIGMTSVVTRHRRQVEREHLNIQHQQNNRFVNTLDMGAFEGNVRVDGSGSGAMTPQLVHHSTVASYPERSVPTYEVVATAVDPDDDRDGWKKNPFKDCR